jgi:hypothetical protein
VGTLTSQPSTHLACTWLPGLHNQQASQSSQTCLHQPSQTLLQAYRPVQGYCHLSTAASIPPMPAARILPLEHDCKHTPLLQLQEDLCCKHMLLVQMHAHHSSRKKSGNVLCPYAKANKHHGSITTPAHNRECSSCHRRCTAPTL